MNKHLLWVCLTPFLPPFVSAGETFDPSRYNVTWDSPGAGPHDSMPLGNGDITLNAWTLADGSLHMLVGKQDSYDRNGRLLKVGGLTLHPAKPGRIGWFHFNDESVGVPATLQHQGLPYDPENDMLLNRIFGGLLGDPASVPDGNRALDAPSAARHHFQLVVATRHPSTPAAWLEETEALAHSARDRDAAANLTAHQAHWREFWQRSWIEIDGPPAGLRIPTNEHPLRIGIDSTGGNRPAAKWGRVSLRQAGDHDFSAVPHDQPSGAEEGVILEILKPQIGPAEGSTEWDLAQGLHAEAWIKIEGRPTGRIFDKVTAGSDDGFLLDLQNGVPRLIVGRHTQSADAPIPTNQWVHLAADLGPEALVVRVNGEVVIRHQAPATNDAFHLTQMYHLQRRIFACAGGGEYPIRFHRPSPSPTTAAPAAPAIAAGAAACGGRTSACPTMRCPPPVTRS